MPADLLHGVREHLDVPRLVGQHSDRNRKASASNMAIVACKYTSPMRLFPQDAGATGIFDVLELTENAMPHKDTMPKFNGQ